MAKIEGGGVKYAPPTLRYPPPTFPYLPRFQQSKNRPNPSINTRDIRVNILKNFQANIAWFTSLIGVQRWMSYKLQALIQLFLNGFGSNFQEMSLISCWSTYPKLRSINQSIKKILALKWPFFWQAKNIWGRFFLYPPGMPFMQKKFWKKFFGGGHFLPPLTHPYTPLSLKVKKLSKSVHKWPR